jgi:hypothetical protein
MHAPQGPVHHDRDHLTPAADHARSRLGLPPRPALPTATAPPGFQWAAPHALPLRVSSRGRRARGSRVSDANDPPTGPRLGLPPRPALLTNHCPSGFTVDALPRTAHPGFQWWPPPAWGIIPPGCDSGCLVGEPSRQPLPDRVSSGLPLTNHCPSGFTVDAPPRTAHPGLQWWPPPAWGIIPPSCDSGCLVGEPS